MGLKSVGGKEQLFYGTALTGASGTWESSSSCLFLTSSYGYNYPLEASFYDLLHHRKFLLWN